MRLWLSVMGCCVFAYLWWRSVGREVLDTSGNVTSSVECCGLATLSPVVWWRPQCLPPISSCQWCVGEAVDDFWSVELLRMCREQSIAQPMVKCGVVHPKAQLLPSFAIFCISAPSSIQILSQDMERFIKATRRWELEVLELSSLWQSLPQLAGRHCLPLQAHFSMPLSACPGSLAPEIPFYLYFSIPGEDKHRVMQSRLVISLRCQEFKTCHLVVWAWSTQNKGNPPKNPPSSKCSLFLKCSCVWGRKWVFMAPATLSGFLSAGELSCSRIS